MPRGQNFKAAEIIAMLREAEVELARGEKVPEVCKQIGVTESTVTTEELTRLLDVARWRPLAERGRETVPVGKPYRSRHLEACTADLQNALRGR
ncbi:hypothetical protein [Aeoliella sp. SH292]|uniref:hypothetical protein n=1 Tax=Aeoliella sp. SH292 TaxID=3454464 RepID=UPI003F95D389